MNSENHDNILNSLTILGFEDTFKNELMSRMKLGMDEFSLKANMDHKEKGNTLYDLRFGKGKPLEGREGDFYFINKCVVTFQRPEKEPLSHEFILFKQNGYNVDQMQNMMEGRSVYNEFPKNGQLMQLWRRIDFTAKDEYGNNILRGTLGAKYNLDREINKLQIYNLTTNDKEALKFDLRNGDRAPVIVQKKNTREQLFAEAMPHLGTILLFNSQGERISLDNNKLKLVSEGEPALSETTYQIMKVGEQQNQQQTQQQAVKPGTQRQNSRRA